MDYDLPESSKSVQRLTRHSTGCYQVPVIVRAAYPCTGASTWQSQNWTKGIDAAREKINGHRKECCTSGRFQIVNSASNDNGLEALGQRMSCYRPPFAVGREAVLRDVLLLYYKRRDDLGPRLRERHELLVDRVRRESVFSSNLAGCLRTHWIDWVSQWSSAAIRRTAHASTASPPSTPRTISLVLARTTRNAPYS